MGHRSRHHFDNMDHELTMSLVAQHTQDKTILMYVERFLKAKAIREDGTQIVRTKGTPQGGVISPLLANLYLHEAFDMWMQKAFPDIAFERYADDIIVHCVSEKQAQYILDKIKKRLLQFKLELHPDKTKIVYAGKDKNPDSNPSRKFTFLGYEFKPRGYWYKNKAFTVFTPAIGGKALKKIQKTMDGWNFHSKTFVKLKDLAKAHDAVIRGWINYYGHFRRGELYKLAHRIDAKLAKWLKRKHKSLHTFTKAYDALNLVKQKCPKLFSHWYMISQDPTRAV